MDTQKKFFSKFIKGTFCTRGTCRVCAWGK